MRIWPLPSESTAPDEFPALRDGFVLTHFLVVDDQDGSREFYRTLFDAQVLVERDPPQP